MKKKAANGFNIIYILFFIFFIIIAIILSFVSEILISIGLSVHTYFLKHMHSVVQLIMNSIILVSYFLFFYFYFKR